MKVVLQKDVKDLGKVGEVVSVKNGFARNFLFPRKLAVEASEKNVKQWEHLKQVAEAKKKKAQGERKELIEKVNGQTVNFKVEASESDKLFGSISNHDISKKLEELNFSIDKKDIHLEPIKVLGQHKAEVKLGEDLVAEINVLVERKTFAQ